MMKDMKKMKDGMMMMCEDHFMVKSTDKNEIKEMAKMHLKNVHDMEASDEELEKQIMPISKDWE